MATNGTTVELLLGREAVAALTTCRRGEGPARQGHTDPEFYRLEQANLFPRRWMAIGVAHDVAEPGDAKPVNVAGWPR